MNKSTSDYESSNTDRMKTLAERLRYSRERAKLSQSELARRVGIKPQAIQFIESGKVYKPRNILEIAETVGVDAHWLSTGRGEMQAHAQITRLQQRFTQVPLINWREAVQWPWASRREAEKYVPTTAEVSEHAFALEVTGDAMEPEFAAHDIIVVDPKQATTHNGYVVAHVQNCGEAVLRQMVHEGGRCYLKPLNARYAIQEWQDTDRVCATVVYKSKAYTAT